MPRKYTKKKGGSARPKRANAASPASSPATSPRGSRSSSSKSSSPPGSNSRLIRKKASKSPL